MPGFRFHAFRFAALAGAVLILGGQAPVPTLQRVADEAAMAAVAAFAAGGTPADAHAAAQRVAAAGGVTVQVNTVPETLTVSIKVTANDKAAVASARYLPPEKPANFAWAARQRFAVKPLPVVIGACIRDCGR